MKKQKLLIDRLKIARGWTASLLDDIEEDMWFKMPGPGIGHTAWQVAHIAAAQAGLIKQRCFGKDMNEGLPPNFIQNFGRGSTPVADPAAHPSIPEIREIYQRVFDDCLKMVSEMKSSELKEPTHGDPHPLFFSKETAIMTAAMHETFHGGQLAMIRRLAGKAWLR